MQALTAPTALLVAPRAVRGASPRLAASRGTTVAPVSVVRLRSSRGAQRTAVCQAVASPAHTEVNIGAWRRVWPGVRRV